MYEKMCTPQLHLRSLGGAPLLKLTFACLELIEVTLV
jgi:hypothetical protein